MFSNLVGKLDLLGDGDAVLGDARRADRILSNTTLRPLGPSVTLTALASSVDAAQHAVARVTIKSDFLGSHVCSDFFGSHVCSDFFGSHVCSPLAKRLFSRATA
jgi:hypothetical protein